MLRQSWDAHVFFTMTCGLCDVWPSELQTQRWQPGVSYLQIRPAAGGWHSTNSLWCSGLSHKKKLVLIPGWIENMRKKLHVSAWMTSSPTAQTPVLNRGCAVPGKYRGQTLLLLTQPSFPPVILLPSSLLSHISGLLCFLWLVQSQWSLSFQKHQFSFQWLPGLYADCFMFGFHSFPCVCVSVCVEKEERGKAFQASHPVLQLCGSLSRISQQLSRRVGLQINPIYLFLTVLNTWLLTHACQTKLVCQWKQVFVEWFTTWI